MREVATASRDSRNSRSDGSIAPHVTLLPQIHVALCPQKASYRDPTTVADRLAMAFWDTERVIFRERGWTCAKGLGIVVDK